MHQSSTLYVGMDVHKDTIAVRQALEIAGAKNERRLFRVACTSGVRAGMGMGLRSPRPGPGYRTGSMVFDALPLSLQAR